MSKAKRVLFHYIRTILLLILINNTLLAQNLIPNPGFEKNINGKVCDWIQPTGRYYHYSTRLQNVNQEIHTNSYNAIHLCNLYYGSEYLVVKLKKKLIKGQEYCTQMRILIESLNFRDISSLATIDWKFMTAPPSVSSRTNIYEDADILFPLNASELPTGLKLLKQPYTANGHEQYLVIGKFFSHKNDSLWRAGGALKEKLIKEKDEAARLVNDTFASHYPTAGDFINASSGKQTKKLYNKVLEVDEEKRSILNAIEEYYSIKIDSVNNATSRPMYNLLIHFDDICLSPISIKGNCDCSDSIPVNDIEIGNTYRLNNITFETGKYTLTTEAQLELDKLVILLNQKPLISIKIMGHTDNTNTPAANLKLSEERAKACADYLLTKGIDTRRISSQGFGSEKPLVSNDTEEGRETNRRVEFSIQQ